MAGLGAGEERLVETGGGGGLHKWLAKRRHATPPAHNVTALAAHTARQLRGGVSNLAHLAERTTPGMWLQNAELKPVLGGRSAAMSLVRHRRGAWRAESDSRCVDGALQAHPERVRCPVPEETRRSQKEPASRASAPPQALVHQLRAQHALPAPAMGDTPSQILGEHSHCRT